MDNTKQTNPAHLDPPKESHTSIVLNSVGNGMMLGSIPFLGIEAYEMIKGGKRLPPIVHSASIAAAAVGGVMGWIFGEQEATRLENYRSALSKEVRSLREDVNGLTQERRSWQEKSQTSLETDETIPAR